MNDRVPRRRVSGPAPSRRRRADHLLVALAGLAVLVACGLVARHGTVGPAERHVFHAVNDLPQWLYRPMWAFQQVGNLLVALALVLLVALLLRRPWLAAAAVVGVGAKLGLERVVKLVVERQRPGTSVGDATLRGAVPGHGLSFVSGHAVITAAFATLLTPVLPGRWKMLPWALVLLNAAARVYVGAHNPLDVVGGAGLGVFIGGVLNAVVAPTGARSRPEREPPVDTAAP